MTLDSPILRHYAFRYLIGIMLVLQHSIACRGHGVALKAEQADSSVHARQVGSWQPNLRRIPGRMDKRSIFMRITDTGVVPVVRAASAEIALKAVEAIYQGGIRVAEITMTVPGAIRVLERLADTYSDRIVLGAGTVYDAETGRACILAGAAFLVTPSLNLSLIRMAQRYSKVVIPGALTPTEVLAAWESGADAVKIFPCGAVGGPKYIKALRGPFPQIEFVPTGGVTLETIGEFLKAGAGAVGVGSELVDARTLDAEGAKGLEDRARKFLETIQRVRGGALKAKTA